jgi:hypothetical protein
LGTGLGSALILDGAMHAMELGDLPYQNGQSFSEYLKKATLKQLGRVRWSRHVEKAVSILASAIQPDYTVIGGGQAKLVLDLPRGTELVDNKKAFLGGMRLWHTPAWFRRKLERSAGQP